MENKYVSIINELLREREYDSRFGTYEGKDFLIASGWDEVAIIETELGKGLDEMLEDNWGFNDEYDTCSDCSKVLRTSPDSYHWMPTYVITDGARICKDCLDVGDYLESIENNPKTANQVCSIAEILEAGYKDLTNELYESGWCGTNDNPTEIYDRLRNEYDSIIFTITDVSQFSQGFAVYGKAKEVDEE